MNLKWAVFFFTGLISVILLGFGWAGDDRDFQRNRVLPDDAFKAIVQDATKAIDSSIRKGESRSTYINLRVNALVIALAADNRLNKKEAARSAVDLRDSALHLVEGLDLHHTDRHWVLSHAALSTSDNGAIHSELARRFAALERLPERKPGNEPRPVRYRLSSRFTHGDVAFFFGGCGGHDGHKIEADLLRLTEKGFGHQDLGALELMGYKVALVAELLRDFDEDSRFFRNATPERRKQWVGFSMDLEDAAWAVADGARSKQVETTKQAITKLDNTCTTCHRRAGVRNMQ